MHITFDNINQQKVNLFTSGRLLFGGKYKRKLLVSGKLKIFSFMDFHVWLIFRLLLHLEHDHIKFLTSKKLWQMSAGHI